MPQKKNTGKYLKQSVQKKNAPRYAKPQKAGKPQTVSKAVMIVTILTLLVGLAACVFFLSKLGISMALPSSTIPEGVKIAGVDVGGMSKKEAAEAVNQKVSDTYASQSLVVTVMDQQLEITPAVSRVELDVDGAVQDAFRYGTDANPSKHVDLAPHLHVDADAIAQAIEAFSVHFPTDGTTGGYEILTQTADGKEQTSLVITVGTASYNFDADALYKVIMAAYSDNRFEAAYNCTLNAAETVDLDAIYAQTCTEPKDATWDADAHEVVPSVTGLQFDLEAAKAALAEAQPGDTLQIPYVEIEPMISTENLEEALFRDVLGTYTAKSGSSYNRDINLKLSCEAIDGTILYPGDVFSYNDALGERTPEKGYKPADSYEGSKTVQTYGGGICQASSSLYYCTLLADLEIVKRSNHGFVSSYMPYGMDATVAWGGPDFQFRNSTNYPIRIDAEANGGTVTVSLVGTDEKDYYVKMEYEILSVSYPEIKEKEVGPDEGHKDGEVETSAYTGYTVQTYKCKYDKETDALISRQKEAFSEYDKRDKVVYKVVDSTEPTEPETTEPAPTEPEPTEPAPTEPEATEPEATEPEVTEPETTEPEPTEPDSPPIGEAGGDVELPGE